MSVNISREKREQQLRMLEYLRKHIASEDEGEKTGELLSFLNDIEKTLKGKKFGLVFEKHREKIQDLLDTHLPWLEEEKELRIEGEGPCNYLIEGDNLASLQLLLKTHREKIDLCIIDPPYNRERMILSMTMIMWMPMIPFITANGLPSCIPVCGWPESC